MKRKSDRMCDWYSESFFLKLTEVKYNEFTLFISEYICSNQVYKLNENTTNEIYISVKFSGTNSEVNIYSNVPP